MSTKANYPISEIGKGKVGFSKTRAIIEGAFYGNNVIKVNTLKEAYELAKNSPGTIVTDMPIKDGDTFGLEKDAKVLLFNDGAVTGRYAAARRIKGEPGVDAAKLDKYINFFILLISCIAFAKLLVKTTLPFSKVSLSKANNTAARWNTTSVPSKCLFKFSTLS